MNFGHNAKRCTLLIKKNLEYRERNKTGTENNFTFFYGDELIQRKTSLARNPLNFKKTISTPTLDGYLTGMADDMFMSMLQNLKKYICFFCAIEAIGGMFRQQNYRKWRN
jgi:hypothetical protein